jgi:hypothetical protein
MSLLLAIDVDVIATATNTVVATVPASTGSAIAIVPPPPGVPFLAFSAQAAIHFGSGPNQDDFAFHCSSLSSTGSNGINLPNEPVKVQVGTSSTTFPPRSFTKHHVDHSPSRE